MSHKSYAVMGLIPHNTDSVWESAYNSDICMEQNYEEYELKETNYWMMNGSIFTKAVNRIFRLASFI